MGNLEKSPPKEGKTDRCGATAWLKGTWKQVRQHVSRNRLSLALCLAACAAAAGLVFVGEGLGCSAQATLIVAGVLAAFALLQWGKFLPADWFLAFLLCAAASFYFVSVGYQADVRDRAGRDEKTVWLGGGAQEGAALLISYPLTIPLEPADKPGWPLSACFQPPAAEAGVATTHPLTYVVSLIPAHPNLIVFTNERAVPIVPQIAISSQGRAEPSALYLRQNATMPRSFPVTATFAITMHDANGLPIALSGSPTLQFALEDARSAWRRHFFALLLGPTTPFLAVAGSVVALAVWWWQEQQKRSESDRRAKFREVRGPRELVQKCKAVTGLEERKRCLEQAERKLEEIRKKYQAVSELQEELRLSTEAVRWAQLDQIRSTVAEDWEQAYNHYKELQTKKETEGWKDQDLLALLWKVDVLIRQYDPKHRRPEIPAVANWVHQKGLKFNPFGPEKAEEDPYFPRRGVQPPEWEKISSSKPTIIEGAPGSGRTAARLYLAHYCEKSSLISSSGRPDTLVVPMDWPLEGPPGEAAVACRKAVAAAIAEANLRQLAQQPDLFGQTPFHQQQALAVLLRLTRSAIGDPGVYLKQHGLKQAQAEEITGLVNKMSQYITMPQYNAEREIVHLLARARLGQYAQYFVCVEIPDLAAEGEPNAEAQAHLQTLGAMMASFARVAVFKVFIRPDQADRLQAPDAIPRATLTWNKEQLKSLLSTRLQAAGAAEDLKSLFSSIKADLDSLLLEAALKSTGAPLRLIRLGNVLVWEEATNPPLTLERVEAILNAEWEGSNG